MNQSSKQFSPEKYEDPFLILNMLSSEFPMVGKFFIKNTLPHLLLEV